MERWTKPAVLITTFQPYLLGWLLVISFFLALTAVSVISRGRSKKELAVYFGLFYAGLLIGSLVTTHYIVDIQVVQFELLEISR